MPVKMSYALATDDAKKPMIVDGFKIDLNFACRKGKRGWEITHTPTGRLLTQIHFHSFDDCELFVSLLKSVEGELWFSTDPFTIKVKMPRRVKNLLHSLDNLANREPILRDDRLREMERILYA